MADGYLLSEGDRRKVQDLIAAQQPRALHPTSESDMPYSPDVYIALPHPDDDGNPGTIPALTKGSSSTDPDHPGFALCTIYQVVDGASSSYDLQPISDLTYMVFNTSTAVLTGYVVVSRAKDGTWLAANNSQKCRRCKGTLVNALAFGDSTCTLNNVLPTDGGSNPFSTSTVDSVLNTFHFAALSAAQARMEILIASSVSDTWELVQVEQQQYAFLEDIDFGTSTKKVRTVVGMFGPETSSSFSLPSFSLPSFSLPSFSFSLSSYSVQVMTNLADSASGAVGTFETIWVLGTGTPISSLVLPAGSCS